MTLPFPYPRGPRLEFGGAGTPVTFEDARAVIWPVPLDVTTSYVPGTRRGPTEILLASAQLELWDEEIEGQVHDLGLYTLPEMELPALALAETMSELHRVASAVVAHDKFLVTIGGEHSITPPLVRAMADHHPGLSVLQIDAHADLRDRFEGTPLSHACAMRRTLKHAPCTQVGIRSLSREEAAKAPELPTTIFYDVNMRQEKDWIERVVASLGDPVYITIDCDGLDPAIMPAVGTPEPGGLSWAELLALLRAVFSSRRVVGGDVVELCPIPGLVFPNVLCAKLVYKLVTYRFGLAGPPRPDAPAPDPTRRRARTRRTRRPSPKSKSV